MRVAFFGTYANTRYPYAGELAHCDGMPSAAGTGLENVLELYGETGNKGNMYATQVAAFDARSREFGISDNYALKAARNAASPASLPPVLRSSLRRLLTRTRHV